MPTAEEKAELAARKAALLEMTDAFCLAHLDEDYRDICRRFIEKLARKRDVPFKRGDVDIWAATVIHALGSANFLFDPSTQPHVTAPQIAEYFNVKPRTVGQKASVLRDLMKLDLFNTEFATQGVRAVQTDIQNQMSAMTAAMFSPEDLADAPRFFTRSPEPGEFIDDDHYVMSTYYEVLERLNQGAPLEAVEKALRLLIEHDPDFFDTYVLLSQILEDQERDQEAAEILDKAYRGAVERLTSATGEWPQKLEWGWLENRHLIRALAAKASSFWEFGDVDAALDLLRRLLAGDPRDAMGLRFTILAIRTNIDPEEFGDLLESEDSSALELWFDKHAPAYPHEFSGWFDALEAADGETY